MTRLVPGANEKKLSLTTGFLNKYSQVGVYVLIIEAERGGECEHGTHLQV